MARVALAVALVCLVFGAVALAEETAAPAKPADGSFDIGQVANRMFADLALLPTRLTSYNSHDDAAQASYTCCHPDQEEQIERALKSNDDFVKLYPMSDYADDALFHSGRVNSVKRDFLHEVACWRAVAENYPDGQLWADAVWNLAQCYARDKDRPTEISLLNTLIDRKPNSIRAADACLALARAYMDVRDERNTLRAFQLLATRYRTSQYCDDAMLWIGQKYQQMGSYDQAVSTYRELEDRFPMSPLVDDAQLGIADSLRACHNTRDAWTAYQALIQRMPGSTLVRQAMTEMNTIRDGTWNLKGHFPCDDAQDLFDLADHYQNYRQFAEAVATYTQFIRRFPGNDHYDEAWFNIGMCYEEMNRLFQKINEAKGPDDLFRLTDDFRRGTGGLSTIPTDRKLTAVGDATSAFGVVVNNLIGSNLREVALREIAKCYEHSNMPDAAAFTYQEQVIYFPYEFEPDEGDMRGKGAICKVLRYYADPAHYTECAGRYARLARAYPDVFPPELYQSKDEFLALMSLYLRHAEHAFFEMWKHIPYRLSIDELRQDARYNLACLNMDRGQYKLAATQLRPFLTAPSSDFSAPAAYVYARAEEILGDKDKAVQAYKWLLDVHGLSGLADDAKAGIERVNAGGFPADVVALTQATGTRLGRDITREDVWVGQNAVVYSPWIASAKMRQYNMPNIWDEAERQLYGWTGTKPTEKVVIFLDSQGGQNDGGNPVCVSAWQINDPPQWNLGLAQLSHNAVLATNSKVLQKYPIFSDALAKFAASALQYQLVTETRDTIGSASAVKLPQEEVINARQNALKALEDYVRAEPDASKLNADVLAGMLYALLDQNGYSKQSLIDWEPYTRFFEALARSEGRVNPADPKDVQNLFVYGINQAFGTDCCKQFTTWGFAVDPGRLGALCARS